MYLVISTSLKPSSRSRLLARRAAHWIENRQQEVEWVDLADQRLPACDAGACYADPNVQQVGEQIRQARAILIAAPVYNYDLSSTAKNLIELTGKAWTGKVVGFLCAAGGPGSYMSVMGVANSLMLDFRSLIIPRFVYATESAFEDDRLVDPEVDSRIEALVDDLLRIATALES